MRILLTGSSGWLGRCLAPRLRAIGHVVIGLDLAAGSDTQIIGSVAPERLTLQPHDEEGSHCVAITGLEEMPHIVAPSPTRRPARGERRPLGS